MHQLLQPGKPLATAAGQQIQVDAFLGGGGQGEVYRVTLNAQPLALKWYFPQQATAGQRAAIAALVQKGSPGPAFLWPLELVEPAASGAPIGFGYLMPLREPRFKGLVDLMKRRVEPGFSRNTAPRCYASPGALRPEVGPNRPESVYHGPKPRTRLPAPTL